MRAAPAVLLFLPLLIACPPLKDSSEESQGKAGTSAKVKEPPGEEPAIPAISAPPDTARAEAPPDAWGHNEPVPDPDGPGAAPAVGGKVGGTEKGAGGYRWPLYQERDPADPQDAKKKAFTIDALYRIPSIADPRWSPDGRRILFVVTRYTLKEGKKNADIYRVDADGKGLRRMTRNKASDTHPRWSPDGRSFLFLSSRKDGAQVWRMPADGGEAEQITSLSTGASEPAWAPDGKRIGFVSSVFPGHGADDKRNKALLDDIKASPLKAHLADELLYRHWTFYKDGQRDHILVMDLKSKEVIDVTPGDFDSPAFSLGGAGFAFSPDGKEICFVSNREPANAQSWTTNKDLWVVSSGGGEARNLTAGNKAYDGHPIYSPDGKYIAYLRQGRPGYEADMFDLALHERETGKVRILTQGFDNWALDLRWTTDSRAIVFKAPVRGRFPLHRVEVTGGKVTRLGIPLARAFDLARDGRIALVYTAVDQPVDLYVTDPQGREPRRLTRFGEPVAQEHDLRPATEMWLPGAGGRKVHTFVVTPHGFKKGKRYPLIINVHGGPQYQWSDMLRGDWQVYPGAGYVVAFFNPHGSIGYGQAYTAAISKDWGGKVYQDVMKVTEALAKLPYVDPDRIGAMGWSWGGYMMNWMLGHTQRFKAYASMMGVYDLRSMHGSTEELWFPEWDIGGTPWDNPEAYSKWSPSMYAKKFNTPTLVITGEKDYRVPYTQSLQLFTALRRRGVPARLIVFPDDGHWPNYVKSMPLYYAAHLDWFKRYLGGGGSPWKIEAMVQGRAFKGKK